LGVLSAITNSYERINETAPFKYLMGDQAAYRAYSDFHIKNGLPIMTSDKFDSLIESIEKNGYDDKRIILVQDDNLIYDGQHRATVLAFLKGLDFRISVLEVVVITKRQIIKQILKFILPKSITRKYLDKRFGRS